MQSGGKLVRPLAQGEDPRAPAAVPGFKFPPHFQFQLPTKDVAGGSGDGSLAGSPPPTWETWTAFPASSFGLVQRQPLRALGDKSANESPHSLPLSPPNEVREKL